MSEYAEKMVFYQKLVWDIIYKHTRESEILAKVIIAFIGSLLLILSGEIRIPLPFTPVPITAQTFVLFLLSVILGFKTGTLSFTMYILWIVITSGLKVFAGPTAGYLIGFIVAGSLTGYLFDNFKQARKFFHLFLIFVFGNFFIIHTLGILGLSIYFKTLDFYSLILIGSAPFIIGDLLKIFSVVLVLRLIYPFKTD